MLQNSLDMHDGMQLLLLMAHSYALDIKPCLLKAAEHKKKKLQKHSPCYHHMKLLPPLIFERSTMNPKRCDMHRQPVLSGPFLSCYCLIHCSYFIDEGVFQAKPTTEPVKLSVVMKAIHGNQLSRHQLESRGGRETRKNTR